MQISSRLLPLADADGEMGALLGLGLNEARQRPEAALTDALRFPLASLAYARGIRCGR